MATLEQFALLIGEFGAQIGAESLALDASGACTLVIDNRLFIEIEYQKADAVVLSTRLGPVPSDITVYQRMLEANGLSREAAGAVLALDPGTSDGLLLIRVPAAGLDLPAFRAALETFIDQAEAWTGALASADSAEPEVPPAVDDGEAPSSDAFIIRG